MDGGLILDSEAPNSHSCLIRAACWAEAGQDDQGMNWE